MSEQRNGSPVELRSKPADNILAATNAIPARLRSFPHWVVWRYVERHGKRTKVPFNPRTEQLANPSNVDDCWTFDLCAYQVEQGKFDGVGFVFSDHSPFSGIDLDSPFVRPDGTRIVEGEPDYADAWEVRASHWRIIEEFASYTEWSPSGIGAHIIVEGKLNDARKQGKIEVYSRDRFFTITGDQRGLRDWPIAERQATLDVFASRLGPGMSALRSVYDREQTLSDDEVKTRCRSELFDRLWSGQDDSGYKSGSEADQALGNLIGQNTDNLEQCVRVFMSSPRYQHVRTKLQSRIDLVQRACRRAFDQKSPPIDFDALRGTVSGLLKRPDGQVENRYAHLLQEYPPGLLGEIAQFVFDRAPRPVFEMAIVAAIGLIERCLWSSVQRRIARIGAIPCFARTIRHRERSYRFGHFRNHVRCSKNGARFRRIHRSF